MGVTLYVRVWIETCCRLHRRNIRLCHPLREGVDWNLAVLIVKPGELSHPLREGVDWNKIGVLSLPRKRVTLYVRVWIETKNLFVNDKERKSHPLREGVDWNGFTSRISPVMYGHPLREGVDWNCRNKRGINSSLVTLYVRVWIETFDFRNLYNPTLSPSTWGCGLKRHRLHGRCMELGSPSTWGCGLKLINSTWYHKESLVTLYVRVWIETLRQS